MSPEAGKTGRPERNADQTRQRIVVAAYNSIYRNGFQGMRLEDIIAETGLTKGALYHHFPNKMALGYAVVEECIADMVASAWVRPLDNAEDPVAELIGRVAHLETLAGEQVAMLGCPLNNLAQEMSPLDEGFRTRLSAVLENWQNAVMRALDRGKEQGTIGPEVDSRGVAILVMAAIEGCIGMAKGSQDIDRLLACRGCLADYLRSLRAPA